ncbi:site-specific integrase [Candidatus Bathyarchaeota archaeon]|nr:site-specific integrase [Candidatus Bathyarchaeota archaeon]
MKAKYAHLLGDADVRRWFENLAAKSVVTATVYLRTLGFYCYLNETDPKAILKVAKSKAFRDGFTDFIRMMEREGKAGSYLSRFKKVLNSWLAYNGVNVKLKVNIRGESDTPRIADERVPNKEELDRILRMATPRGRVSIALMAFSGLRPESIGSHDGSDGLRLGDFVEAEIRPESIEFPKVPSMLVVRKSLSKARHQYFTFVPQQTITYVEEHLEERVKHGEELSKNSPLLGFDPRGVKKNRFLRTTLVTRDIKEAIRRAGFNWRPYVLRAYCDTNMIIAESKGKISHPYLQFIMGHKGDIEARYSTNKGVLPPDMIEDMRKAYKECEPFLSTATQPLEQSSIIKEAKIEALKSMAKSLLGIDLLDVKVAKERQIGRELSKDEELELYEKELKKLREGRHNPQRIIHEKELEKYLAEGWQFVSVLPSQRILIKRH